MKGICRVFMVFGLISMLAACSPVKGYSGPELPPEQVSTVTISHSSSEIEYQGAEMNGISFSSAGITVLPGEHRFSFQVTAKDPPFNCRRDSELDYYSYERCLKKGDKKCDCFDYMTIYEECFREAYDGRCEGQIRTQAGINPSIQVVRDREGARAYVPGGQEARCSDFRRRILTERESKGTGRYTAQSNGIYTCR